MKKAIYVLILTMISLMFAYVPSYGWGISWVHSDANPLILHPGDSGSTYFCINNLGGENDVTVKVDFDGVSIGNLVEPQADGLWIVPAGTCEPIYISVNIPLTDYQTDYTMTVHAEETGGNCGGSICMGIGYRIRIIVQVTPAVLTVGISEPSGVLTKSGPITYDVSYGDARYITLSAANVTLNTTGTATGNVSVEGTRVTISDITGDGTIGISIAAGTSSDSAGNLGPAAGPSTTFKVLSTPPMTLFRTGQASCYDEAGMMIPCAGTGQDGDLRTGLPWLSPRFTDNGNGTMTDRMTGLIWSKDANVMATRDPDFGGANGTVTCSRAFEYIDKLNAEEYLGFHDWRLPTKEELSTFVDLNTVDSSAWLRNAGFAVNADFNYWSSSTAWWKHMAITMQLSNGDMPDDVKETTSHRVWPVRGAAQNPWPTPRFKDNSDGTITDNLTGLVWLKNANCFGPQLWSDALTSANNLASGSCGLSDGSIAGDWRMPSIVELRSLENPDVYSAATWWSNWGFTNTWGGLYWSSTTYLSSPDYAWSKHSEFYGRQARDKKTSGYIYLWPVRNGNLSPRPSLSVSKTGNGSGTVISNPPGINCGSDCNEVYASGTQVTLSPQPASDSYFAGWTGCSSVDGDQCTVSMDGNKNIVANFALASSLADNLVAYYPLTANASDVSGNDNHGIVYGASLTTDRFGNADSAYFFDGSSNYIEVPNSSTLNITSDQLTISYWINWQNDTNYCANFGVSKGGYDLHNGYELLTRGSCGSETENGFSDITIGSDTSYNAPVANANSYRNQWVHMVGVLGNNKAKIYMNGVPVSEAPVPVPPKDSSNSSLYIGTRAPGNLYVGWLNGKIDDVRIYNRALSETEISVLYANESPTKTLAVTKTGDGSGNVTSVSATIECGSSCTGIFASGTTVTLSAAPAAGSYFLGWSGACNSATSTCEVTMDSAKDVAAMFMTSASSGSVVHLPKTGATKCYDAAGTEIACNGTGQDGDIRAGVAWPSPRFTPVADAPESECVVDNLTGLMWVKNGNMAGSSNMGGANDYANNLTLCGYSDWRLPDINEMRSLINVDQPQQALWLISQGFADIQSDLYWTSSVYSSSQYYGWRINMSNGFMDVNTLSSGGFVLPVRGNQTEKQGPAAVWHTGQVSSTGVSWPSPRFNDAGNGQVTDYLTGLIWTADANVPGPSICAPGESKTWQSAIGYVKCLNANNYLGHNDWRVPNSKELQSLADYSQTIPSLPPGHPFTNIHSTPYWSSTSRAEAADYAWVLSMDGGTYTAYKGASYYIWPVRGGQADQSVNLTISKSGTGGGIVNSSFGGINCGSNCTANYDQMTSVTLRAVAASDAVFTGWSGDCSGTGICVVKMNAAKNVTAVFSHIDVVNGACGLSNGGVFAAAPTTNLCGDGSTPTMNGTGPWNWTCTGQNGGSDAACSAQACDTTPDAFTFTDRIDIALNTLITSNTITINGITCAAPIFITGGSYSINGGAYVSEAGLVNNGDTVTVQMTSSAGYSTTTDATLTIGGVSDTFSVTTNTVSVTDSWTQKADSGGTARIIAVGFSIGSKGYIGTGWDGSLFQKDFWEYDPSADTWTQKADFGGAARGYAVGFSIGSKGYIGTGADDSSYKKDFWEYDSSANTWTRKADFGGTVRGLAVSFSIGSKGYIGTGYDGTSSYRDFWEYDPSTDAWTRKADFGGTARAAAVGFSIGSKGYIGTGYDGSLTYGDFWEYDPSTDAWTRKADFSGTARYVAVGFSIGSKGYIGTGSNEYIEQDFWEYDPSSATWTQKANFGGSYRDAAVGFSIGNKGYIGTGSRGSAYYKDFWEYHPADTVPDAFTFTDQNGVILNTVITSNTVTVSGLNTSAVVSVTGGTYSINGGAYTGEAGLVNNGDTVTVQVTSSADYSTTTAVTLTIGGIFDTFSVTTQVAAGYQSGLVGYYTFNGDVNDSSGNGKNGVNYGAIQTKDRFGNQGGALDFQGTYVDLSAVVPALVDYGQGTISLWFKAPSNGANVGAPLVYLGPHYFWIGETTYAFNGESIGFLTNSTCVYSAYMNGNAFYFDDKWHHAVAVMGADFNAIYVDGIKLSLSYHHGNETTGNCMWNPIEQIILGYRQSDNWYFQGSMDDVRIYNRALTDSEITQLYSLESSINITASVDGRSGPWNVSLNPSYPYGMFSSGADNTNLDPTVISSSSGLAMIPGNKLTISYVSGQVRGGGSNISDAGGVIGYILDGLSDPSKYLDTADKPANLTELIGVFANNGVMVGDKVYKIGNGPKTLTIPSGANQLLLGVGDGWYNDNGGSVTVQIVESFDKTSPAITSARSSTADGSYAAGSEINITLNFSEAVSSIGLTITLSTGAVITTGAFNNVTSWSGTYTIAAGQTTADLTITSVTGKITDGSSNSSVDPTIPAGQNIGDGNAIVVIDSKISALYATFADAGIWKNDGSEWSQITTGTPQLMATSGTDLYATFAGGGIWKYNGADWSQTTPNNPDKMVVSGTTLYGTFTGNGIWKFDGTDWSQATPNNPDDMVIAGGSLYGTFGISGIWKFDGSDWSQVTTNTPTQMVGSTNALYGIFAGAGIWKYEGSEWTQVTSNTPEQLISGGTNLYGTFSGSGIWKYDGTDWNNVTSNTPEQMTATSTALYGVFSGTGIWKHDGTTWSQVTNNDPLKMVAGE